MCLHRQYSNNSEHCGKLLADNILFGVLIDHLTVTRLQNRIHKPLNMMALCTAGITNVKANLVC